MIPLIIIGIIIIILLLWFFGSYNGLVGLRNQVKNAWAQIDVQLKRRRDLIPNLVETVKGYMEHRPGSTRRQRILNCQG
jgi:LemA protein